MNLLISTDSETGGTSPIQRVLEHITGGVTLIAADLKTATTSVPKGAMVNINELTGACHLVKTAKVYSTYTGGATSIRIAKNHEFVVGDFISNGLVSTAITVINTTNASYDTFTLTAALDTLNIAANYVLYQGASETTRVATAATCQVADAADEKLTLTIPEGTNRVKFQIAQAGGDTLAVAFTESTGTLLVTLANSSANKNTAALIQTAVRALGIKGIYNLPTWSFTAAENWDTHATGSGLTSAIAYSSGGVAIADCAEKYEANAITLNDLDVESSGNNLLTGAMVRGTVVESLMYYPVHDKNKESLSQIRFI